jgi:hypothetical protein
MHAVSKAVLTQTDSAEFNSPKVRQTAVRAHKRVTEAIRDGDLRKRTGGWPPTCTGSVRR